MGPLGLNVEMFSYQSVSKKYRKRQMAFFIFDISNKYLVYLLFRLICFGFGKEKEMMNCPRGGPSEMEV